MSANKRPPAPADVTLELRREALFGCCRCGNPIYQYHHIVPYEAEPHFRVADMMVLCPNCHDMATKRVLPEADQRRFKATPFNRKRGYVKGLVHVPRQVCEVMLGGNTLIGTGCFVRVDEHCLVSLHVGEEGHLQVSMSIYDATDSPIVMIERNEWVTGDPGPWDFESDYQYLKVRSKPRDVLLEIKADKQPISLRTKMRLRGIQVDAQPRRILINGGPLPGVIISGSTLQRYCLAISSHSGAGGIVPMNLHPGDPLFGSAAAEIKRN